MNETDKRNQIQEIENLIEKNTDYLFALIEILQKSYSEIPIKLSEIKCYENYDKFMEEIERKSNLLALAAELNSDIDALVKELDSVDTN